jgi:S1-C subfamily serine protease
LSMAHSAARWLPVRAGQTSPFDRFSKGFGVGRLIGMTQAAKDLSDSLVKAAQQAGEALVHVSASCRRGATGAVFDDSGVIVTTARAISGERLELTQGDQSVEARLVGVDAATDVGVIRADAPFGRPPTWATSAAQLGALVLSASRPGRAPRVRLGVVSQVGDTWHTPRGARVERYVETDLQPEPGFSGGLGFDAEGRALGMSSAGLLRGVPLLLEKATLDRIVSALLAHGRVRRGYLGVGTQAVRLPDAASASAGQARGLLVSSVQPGSAAERAGLLLGDVLLTLGAATLGDAGGLQAALEDAEGQTLPLGLLRAGQKLVLGATPGARS